MTKIDAGYYWLAMAAMIAVLTFCGAPPEPVDPPPPTTTTATTTTPPTPTPGPKPSDYMRLERVPGILGVPGPPQTGLYARETALTFQGIRDVQYVIRHCQDAAGFLGTSPFLLVDFSEDNETLRDELQRWIRRFESEGPNRRCGRNDDPDWCKVSNVRKNAEWASVSDRLVAAEEEASRLRNRAQRCEALQRRGYAYDSIRGFCEGLQRHGMTAEDCR